MNKKILIMYFFVFTILFSSFVLATGVTYPVPPDIQLLPGESARFRFSIQSGAAQSTCSYQITESTVLDIKFDADKINIEPNRRQDIFGTVTAPEDAFNGEYISKFCASCTPIVSGSGSPLVFRTCGIPIKVNVVGARTRENMKVEIPAEEIPRGIKSIPAYYYLIIVVILIAVILWYRHEKGKGSFSTERRKL